MGPQGLQLRDPGKNGFKRGILSNVEPYRPYIIGQDGELEILRGQKFEVTPLDLLSLVLEFIIHINMCTQ